MVFWFLLILFLFILINKILFFDKKDKLKQKKILIIGGSSGLGKEIAKYLYKSGNDITITSRSKEKGRKVMKSIQNKFKIHLIDEKTKNKINKKRLSSIKYLKYDITTEKLINKEAKEFDYIFCMPGFSIPKFFKDQKISDFKNQMNINYLSIIKCLDMFIKINKKPFTFIVAGSIAGLFYFPGYSSYSPTKSALYAFIKCAGPELEKNGIKLKMILCPTMKTEGLYKENKIKNKFSKEIEEINSIFNAEIIAKYIIKNICNRMIITPDWFGYFVTIKEDCEYIRDYFFLGIAIFVIEFSKWYVKLKFKKI